MRTFSVEYFGQSPSGWRFARLEGGFLVREYSPVGDEREQPDLWVADSGHMFTLIKSDEGGNPALFARGYQNRGDVLG